MKGMIDVCAGKMSLKQAEREIAQYVYWYSPTRLMADIRRKKDGYHVTIWIPKKDFDRGMVNTAVLPR